MDDREILDALREEGRENYAFNLLVRKYSQRLYWHIRRAVLSHDDADDLLQNTFIKAWKNLPYFREESRLYTWLYRIATNETLNFLRRQRTHGLSGSEPLENILYRKVDDDPYFNGDMLQRELHKAIQKLPPRQKAVFNMRYFEELKFTEIAEILNRSVGAVKASYHHAFTKVHDILSGNN